MIHKLETDRPQGNWTSWVASWEDLNTLVWVRFTGDIRSETPDLVGDLGRTTESPLSGFGKPITGDIHLLHVDSPIPGYTEVRDQSPSTILDLTNYLGGKTGTPLSGFGKPITGDIHSLHICLHIRRDEDSSLLAGLDMSFVSVNHPIFGDFNSEFGAVY